MREGFVETKIGLLPKDWDLVKQSDVATFFNGRAYKLTEWEKTGTPVIRLQNLTGTGRDYYYSNLELPSNQYCYKGDLLYMWSATFGPVWWKGGKAIYHYHIWKIEHNIQLLDKNFHYYLLDDVTFRMKNESHGSTMLHVTKGGMEKLLIQLPPLPEQQKIAEILSTVDEKIEIIDQQIAENMQLKKGLMQRLLTKGIGHTEFKDSPLGKIPKNWEVVKLEEYSIKITDGSHYSPIPQQNTGYYIATVKDMMNAKFNMNKCASITKKDFEDLERNGCKPMINDVLFSKDGTIGKTFVYKENQDIVLLSSVAIIRLINQKLNSDFVSQILKSDIFYKQLEGLKSGSAIRRLVLKAIKEIKIPTPSIVEQQKIAKILSNVDEKLEVLSDKKANYQELKQGLMQKLLTGKIRVAV